MWVPAPFTEWAADPRHPYHRAGHPKADSGAIAIMLDGRDLDPANVAVASVTNNYVRVYQRRADGSIIEEANGPRIRKATTLLKGRVNITIRKELTNA